MPEGQLYVAILKKKLAEADEKLRVAAGEDLYRKQGRAQELDELIRELTTAGDVLQRQEPSARRPLRQQTQL